MSETQSDSTTTPEPPPPPPPPTTSSTLWDIPNNSNYRISTPPAVDTRFRLGYPMLPPQGPPPPLVNDVASDLKFARNVMTGLPASSLPAYTSGTDDTPLPPNPTDPFADVKRSLSYSPSTGINFITGASFTSFLRNNFDTRIGDGAVLFRAVDQSYSENGVIKPGLTYFRLGKPEPRLTDAANVQYERADDQLMDQKYKPGIGIFSDGGLNAWLRDPINMRSDEAINLIAPSYCLSTYGESLIVSYEIDDAEDIKKINAGDLTDQDVNRRIINVNTLRSTPLGWYRQIFDRGRNLNYSTSNKGEFSIGASYGLSVGAKFEHSIAVNFGTSLAGKVEINDGFGIEIGASGAAFKGFSGLWSKEDTVETTALSKVSLSIAGIDSLPIEKTLKGFSALLRGATAAQVLAFTAYNAVLAGEADRTLTAADSQDRGDDTYGLKSALDEGMKIYEAALSLSVITAAASVTLAAAQARYLRLRPLDQTTPDIEVSRDGIFLRYGANGIEIKPTGVRIVGLVGGVMIGGVSVTNVAPAAINHQPVPPIIPLVPRTI